MVQILEYILFMPPFKNRTLLTALATLESTGQRWWSQFAGVLIIEAEKQIYAANSPSIEKKVMTKPIIVGSQMTQVNEKSLTRNNI